MLLSFLCPPNPSPKGRRLPPEMEFRGDIFRSTASPAENEHTPRYPGVEVTRSAASANNEDAKTPRLTSQSMGAAPHVSVRGDLDLVF